MWILMGVCTVVGAATLFLTDFIWDAILFAVLIVAMIVVMNKDILMVVQTAKTMLIPKKKTVKEEEQE